MQKINRIQTNTAAKYLGGRTKTSFQSEFIGSPYHEVCRSLREYAHAVHNRAVALHHVLPAPAVSDVHIVQQVVDICAQTEFSMAEAELVGKRKVHHIIARNTAAFCCGIVKELLSDILSIQGQSGGFQRVAADSPEWVEGKLDKSDHRR